MKQRIFLVAIIFLATLYGVQVQIAQIELASGLEKTDFTSLSFKPLSSEAKLTIATLAFFQKFQKEESRMFDEAGVQSTLYWNINESFSIGPGLYYNSVSGFTERLSVLYGIRSTHILLSAIPTIAHSEVTGFINGELFFQIQLTNPLKRDWKLMLSLQMLTHWEQFSDHTRSFQQVRVGLDKRSTQFGLALDYDQYGDAPITRTSLGVFIRKFFQNN